MITIYKPEVLGHANFGWLDSRHHFSFADYYDPRRMHFGPLRVINDDMIKAGSGFDMHPHRDMEIITFVRSGAITHQDSRGNKGRTEAGDVQVMSAGTGILHSEFNLESEDTTLFQIWIIPREDGVEPRWEAATFADKQAEETLPLLVSGFKEDADKGALYIHQDATIHGGKLKAGQELVHPIRQQAYLLVSDGVLELEGKVMVKGTGVEITGQNSINLKAITAAEVIVIDVPVNQA